MKDPNEMSGRMTGSPNSGSLAESGPECSRAIPRSQGADLIERILEIERIVGEARRAKQFVEDEGMFQLGKRIYDAQIAGLMDELWTIDREKTEGLHSASGALTDGGRAQTNE